MSTGRRLLLAGVMAIIIMEIVALSPSSLEQPASSGASIAPESLVDGEDGERTLATGIPTGKIPEYSVDQFNYVSTQGGRKQWKLIAERAFLYNQEKLVHARIVTAYLFDPEGKVTVVSGREAKYFMNQRDLEVFGGVTTRFPDGFETRSEYLRYRPQLGKIDIPPAYAVKGAGAASPEKQDESVAFDSHGLDFSMKDSLITLPRAVKFVMFRKGARTAENQGVADQTTIESDRCVIHRTRQLAEFTMDPVRPLTERFVRIRQPTLFARSRRADLNYGNFSQILQYLVAYEDVLIQETGNKEKSQLRYGTGGRADFDTRRDVVVLTEYPQVYQDSDTVTGDRIIVHRDTDIVEVEHSNAFSEGQRKGQ
jgi:lipopolysaccharide export system protein LptA